MPRRLRHRRTPIGALIGLTLLFAGCGSTAPHEPLSVQAAHYRHDLRHGQMLGHLTLPSFHTTVPIRDGFDEATVDRGPGWYAGSFLPGEHRLVYVAGHHLSHGAPFRHVADLVAGDRVVITTPYATATYSVTGRAIVSERDLSVLHSPTHEVLRLQTSTVPAGTHRILVSARLDAIRAR